MVTCNVKDGYHCYMYDQGQISRSHVRSRADIKVIYGQGQISRSYVRSGKDINNTCTAKDRYQGHM